MIGTALGSGTPVTLVGQGDHRHSFVSVPDIAVIALAVIGNPAAYNQRIAIGGAGAVSWTEVVQRTGKVIGRELPITYVPMGSPLPFMQAAWNLMYSTEMYEGIVPMESVTATYSVTLTPLEQVIGRMFQGKAPS